MTTLSQVAIDNAKAHAEEIRKLMTALDVDFDRLEELTDYAQDLRTDLADVSDDLERILQVIDADAADPEREAQMDVYARLQERQAELIQQLSDTETELSELQDEAGGYTDRDDVESYLYEYPLEVTVRSGWALAGVPVGEALKASEYKILITTGGPAVHIRGELDEHGAPTSARMEASDWGTPWTEVYTGCSDALLEFAQFIIPH